MRHSVPILTLNLDGFQENLFLLARIPRNFRFFNINRAIFPPIKGFARALRQFAQANPIVNPWIVAIFRCLPLAIVRVSASRGIRSSSPV